MMGMSVSRRSRLADVRQCVGDFAKRCLNRFLIAGERLFLPSDRGVDFRAQAPRGEDRLGQRKPDRPDTGAAMCERAQGGAFAARWLERQLNIHPSLLPSFKGLHPQKQALDAGVRISGCTVHFVAPELDSGPIVAQAAVPVLAGDTPDTLAERILVAEHRLYPFALRQVASGAAQLVGGRVVLKEGVNQGDFLYSPMA